MSNANPENRCQQINADGRRCRAPRAADHASLCSDYAKSADVLLRFAGRKPHAIHPPPRHIPPRVLPGAAQPPVQMNLPVRKMLEEAEQEQLGHLAPVLITPI